MRVELIRAWPHRYDTASLELPEGASVAEALRMAGWDADAEITGYAVFGVVSQLDTVLADGDRLELLRPLTLDPKEARRKRARK
ncbi:MAG TPA: RnfH family protein [Pseudoxanthomonas sp.]|nr:RnfH family protein [Pseudoxanthomonas sp.]